MGRTLSSGEYYCQDVGLLCRTWDWNRELFLREQVVRASVGQGITNIVLGCELETGH